MFRTALFALAFAGACLAEQDYVPGEYIFVLKNNASVSVHDTLSQQYKGKKITIGALKFIHAKLSDEELAVVKRDQDVKYVERNYIDHLLQNCPNSQSEPVSWGTVRTTVFDPRDVSQVYLHDPTWGSGVDAYILDTGIRCTHEDFTGRCEFGATFVGGSGADGHGHGTHVAGTVGGTTWGIAKATNLIAAKICTDSGSCPRAGTLEAYEWVINQRNSRGRPGVVNLSIGGGFSQSYNDATNEMVRQGVHVAAAAGNSNANACNASPAAAELILTAGSTEQSISGGNPVDRRSSFSNTGSCVDVFAPGSTIISAGHSSDTAAATMSGTSMACPQVVGVVAYIVSQNPTFTPQQVKDLVISSASEGFIENVGSGSPNLLLHIQC